MSRSSAISAPLSKASQQAAFAGGVKPVIQAVDFPSSDETIRVLLRSHLPHGTKQDLAALAGLHVNQLSRQLSGEDGLHNKTVSAAVSIFRQYPELSAVVSAVHILRNGGNSAELREQTGLLIEFGTGQLCLPGISK